jgi:hypothetical protein
MQLDERSLRPFLIRNYSKENTQMADAFHDIIMTEFNDQDGKQLEKRVEDMAVIVRKMSTNPVMNRRNQNFSQDLLNENKDFFQTRQSAHS